MSLAAAPDFAMVLKRLRMASGLSQEALAERAAVSAQAISALECGLRKAPYPKTVALLAGALGLDDACRSELTDAANTARTARTTASQVRAGNLPQVLGSIVGRSREIAELDAALRVNRLVTVLGPGGIGKTTLALEAARQAGPRYADGTYFCDLSGLGDGSLITGAIAAARDVRLRSDADPTEVLALALRSSHMLLVLDNCEHVVEDAAWIAAALLRSCPNLTILATSRQRLAIGAEATFRPPPLATPLLDDDEQLSAADAMTFPAIALFAERARAVNRDFALTDDNAPLVAQICRRLDGIALAIELAAAQTRAMTVRDIEQRLDQRFRLLRDGRYADPPRQRTLSAAFDWSYALLDERRQHFFRALGIFAGTFTLDAALDICCEPGAEELSALELLAALVDASLLVVDSSAAATRYRLLETTRAYALEKLAEQRERLALAARHLEYYRVHAAEIELERDLEDVRAAATWALAGGDVSAGAELTATIGVQWEKLGVATEGASRLAAFIAATGDEGPALTARLWTALSFLQGHALRLDESLVAARNAVTFARRAGDEVVLSNALRSLSIFAAWSDRFDESRGALEEAVGLAGPTPSPLRTLQLLAARGHLERMSGNHADAIATFEQTRAAARAIGDDYREVGAASHIAEAEHERGNTQRAAALMRELLDPKLAPIDAEAVLANLAGYLVALGDVAGVRDIVRDFFALRLPLARSNFVAAVLEHAALADALSGELPRAARLGGYCDAWYRTSGQHRQFTERRTHEQLRLLLETHLAPDEREALEAEGAEFTAERAARLAVMA